jgi:hypothetical protein
LLEEFFLLDFDVLLNLLHFSNQLLLGLQVVIFKFFSLKFKLQSDLFHVLNKIFLFFNLVLTGLHRRFSGEFHLNLSPHLQLHLLVFILFLHLLLPVLVLALIPHIHLQILHSLLLLFDLFFQLFLLSQNGCHVELYVDFVVLRNRSSYNLLLQLFGDGLLDLLFDLWEVCWPF